MDKCHRRQLADVIADLTLARTHQGSIPGGVQVQSQPPSQPGRVVGTVTSRAGLGSGIGSRTTGATLSPNSGLSAGKNESTCRTRA